MDESKACGRRPGNVGAIGVEALKKGRTGLEKV